MSTEHLCPTCQTPLPVDAPMGLCPRCLFGKPTLSESETFDESQGSDRIGDYELIERIGMGGMGVVYKARQMSLQRDIALKMILPGPHTKFERFQDEAHAIARLRH